MLETEKQYERNLCKCKTTDGIASDLVVAVITVCGNIGSCIDLLKIFDFYMEGGCENFELDYVPNSKKTNGVKNRAFYNCLSVTFHILDSKGDESKIAAKVFPNGSIQIPGCRNIEIVYKAPKILFEFIKHVSQQIPDIVKEPEKFELKDVKIVMINSNFTFEKPVLQENIKNIINENKYRGKDEKDKQWRIATFQPEKYAGVNIKYWTKDARKKHQEYFTESKQLPRKIEGQISILIFKSGKATITGAKNTKDLIEAYNAITELFRCNRERLFNKN